MMNMKESGVEWIGEMPVMWRCVRIGALYRSRTEKVSDRDYLPLSVTKKGIVPQLEMAAKTNYGDNRKLVKDGDFVINSRSDRRGSCGISKYTGSVSLINIVLTPIKIIEPEYYNWVFQCTLFSDEYYRFGHGIVDDLWTTTWQEMKKIMVPVPEIREQKIISKYLTKKCAEIDAIIEDLEIEIYTLEQYKQSLIVETTIQGLKHNVEMKDSGIDWIRDIPAGWEVNPVYFYFDEQKNKNRLGLENNLLSLSYGKIIRKDINTNEGLLPESFNTYNVVEEGDIIIRPTDLQNDKHSLRTGLVMERGIITSAYIALKPIKPVNTAYFHYLLHSYDVMKVFYNMGNGVRQGLNFSEFSHLMLLEPSREEQDSIVEYLDDRCSEIDSLIESKSSQVDTLNEYKKSMIYEYVTGKKEAPVV